MPLSVIYCSCPEISKNGDKMNDSLFVKATEYDYHSILKVAELNYQMGSIRVFDADSGYLVVFKDCGPDAKVTFEQRLRDLTRNIWSY